MVGRSKTSASTNKTSASTSKSKQTSLLDLFPRKNAPSAAPSVPNYLPQPVASTSNALASPAEILDISSSPTKPSTSGPAEIIDITGSSPDPPKPPSKPVSRRTASHKPPSSGPSAKAEKQPFVIDLTDSTVPTPAPRLFVRSESSKNSISPSVIPPQSSQPMYSIFNQRKPAQVAKSAVVIPESDAPFPTKDQQHVRGPQSILTPTRQRRCLPLETRSQVAAADFRIPTVLSDVRPTRTLTRTPASSFWEKEQCVESIPMEHKRDHPAIARLAAAITSPPDESEKLWSDRWRPRRADGVLGNEEKAVFLRDWLTALEVRSDRESPADGDQGKAPRGLKRPQVMRSVTRTKKRLRRESSDGFIVSDASDYSSDGPAELAGNDDDDFLPPSGETASSPFQDHLANTILLSGPSGIGKTTAVYSCADELGWEVFEIYPGIGKRNGASLEALIGEVGKNHLRQAGGIRQSLILIEEVDILFKEDANFWPALIRLIRDSRRPVVLTCNDISLVPAAELPLQTILGFEPCQPEVAGSYLQGLCCAEGHVVDRSVLSELYGSGCDLRHTIHRLQLLCQDIPLGAPPEENLLLDWTVASRESVPHADSISFLDAHMSRGSMDRPKALALTRYDACMDDEIGFPILTEAASDGYGLYEWDTYMSDAVNILSRGERAARVGVGASADYQELVDAAFRNNLAFPVGLPERAAAYTDYLPLARQIIMAEDVTEERYERFGRTTRNSNRYIRSVEKEQLITRERGCHTGITALWISFANLFCIHSLDCLSHWSLSQPVAAAVSTDEHRTLMAASSHNQPHNGTGSNNLAPLEFLQNLNQRRGSITDPSLHAATPRQNLNAHFFRPDKAEPRPTSPYVFGSATHGAENAQLRKLLHSPDIPQEGFSRRNRSDSFRGPGTSRLHLPRHTIIQTIIAGPPKEDGDDEMNVDSEAPKSVRRLPHEPHGQFDYSMRRHSIAVGQNPHTRSPGHLSAPHGLKRKMSADPTGFPTVGEEVDPHLIGPGVSSGMELEAEAPAPKRRGSAIDTQRIAQLSLNDRRDSLDSRPPHWWANDRRDSASSMFSSVSSGDSPHGRPPPGLASFAWPSRSSDQPAPHNEADPHTSVPPRSFDPPPSVGIMPPINFPPDRRMSVPEVGPKRTVRSRSRPPSRQKHSPDANHSGPSSGQDDPVSAPSPTGSGRHSKESSATPYSRSPELRVSHKLAERKRRKEMKELFDELRDQLPADRGMKASKWEILSKAIDFVTQLKQSHQDQAREIEVLRASLRERGGTVPDTAGAQFSASPTPGPLSRPGSSQNPSGRPSQNGIGHRDGPA
ncbi:hypothetical protein FB45DRAFT_1055047 [Roridomyces roridus]|uniref:BHLH domain-containing protein n=1 Tax=Roridomyces roridus TaxID=1738132 RepID=A0AAD7C6G7_9AGAR|nr:hypothetical protein FB45DRAFT_1055047 [Roridomyces roridus]